MTDNAAKYLGMDVISALAAAQAVGEQIRVVANAHIQHRHADDPEPGHILVWVKDGKVSKAQTA